MKLVHRHDWDLTPAAARDLQRKLAAEVIGHGPLDIPGILEGGLVAAVDASFDRGGTEISAAVVIVRMPTFEVVERVGVSEPLTFPYVPGLLSFREAPSVLSAFGRISTVPDVVLCDGQGTAHPRRLGIACHLGLWLNLPTVGCGKSRLCGEFVEPGPRRGDRSPLVDKGETIGAVVRTRDRVSPLFVSPGHLCDLDDAVALVMGTTGKLRLPTPTRMAHDYVNEVRRAAKLGRPIPE
jgi:deoxyribonuclease V